MTKKEKMYEKIKKHGETIINYFGLEDDPIKLCKKLRRLEIKANKIMEQYANGEIEYEEVQNYVLKELKPALTKILGVEGIKSVYINQDPRGYTIKMNAVESERINGYKDWGDYFIFAPDLKDED